MLSCCSERGRRIAPADSGINLNESTQPLNMASKDELKSQRRGSKQGSSGSLLEAVPPVKLTSDPMDYIIYTSIGIGFTGQARILIARHKPTNFFNTVRHINLEVLTSEQLEEIQQEMKLSQLLHHQNIACYLTSFVVGSHLWAVQPLMHYGSCADIMHSAQPFRNGFKQEVIAIIIRDVVQGLEYLHNLGYVHRSIRAKHFLISEDGLVKLSGLRSMISMITEGTRQKSLHGHFSSTVDNICWLAPEVLAQDLSGYSFKSDTYSVGIAALELATGEAPFAGLPVTEIMMLKLRGHPPILMRRQDGEEPAPFSNTFSKVVDLCVHPNPVYRPSPSKLLSMSFLRLRKKSIATPALKDLLKPVVPLDTTALTPDTEYIPSMIESLEGAAGKLTIQEPWIV